MKSPWLHRYAILLAVCTLAVVVTGAFVTSNEARPLFSVGRAHPVAGVTLGILTIGLVLWLARADKRRWMRRLSWTALGLLIVECLLGLSGPPRPLPLSFVHTFLAYLFFSTTVAIALSTSPGWNRESEAVEEHLKRFSSRALATAACTAVVAQVLIGAAFRYAVTNVIVHILGAMVVVALSLAAGLGIKGRFPEHPPLQLAADALIGITLLQVTLGAAVLSLQVINPDDPLPVILAISAHVATAALTLGANVALTIEVYRLVRNTVAKPGVSSATLPTV